MHQLLSMLRPPLRDFLKLRQQHLVVDWRPHQCLPRLLDFLLVRDRHAEVVPQVAHRRQPLVQGPERRRLREQHEEPVERLEEEAVLGALDLEELEAEVDVDGGLDELDELVELHEEPDGDLDGGELLDEGEGQVVSLPEEAQGEGGDWVVAPAVEERGEYLPVLVWGSRGEGGLEEGPEGLELLGCEEDEVQGLDHGRDELEGEVAPLREDLRRLHVHALGVQEDAELRRGEGRGERVGWNGNRPFPTYPLARQLSPFG